MAKKLCDNTNCPNPHKKQIVFEVEMLEEFEGGKVYWCGKCIKRDKEMLKDIIEWSGKIKRN